MGWPHSTTGSRALAGDSKDNEVSSHNGHGNFHRRDQGLSQERDAAVDRLNLEVSDGEFLVLVGPSGCGKTTSLRMLAGLEHVDEGAIRIDDQDVVKLAPRDRDIAMVFQNYALYPHMNVAQNMGFALRSAKVPKAEIDDASDERQPGSSTSRSTSTASRASCPAASASASPWAARSCASRASSSWTSRSPTSTPSCGSRRAPRSPRCSAGSASPRVYVTHDQVEAMTMGDRVAVMKDGVLQQCDTPRALYDDPVNAFVAGFIGSPAMNLIDGLATAEGLRLGSTLLPSPLGLPPH